LIVAEAPTEVVAAVGCIEDHDKPGCRRRGRWSCWRGRGLRAG
jgi:hypothetical protein